MSPGLDGALPKNGYSFPGSFSRLSDGACGIALISSAYGGQWSNGASSRCAYNGFLPGTSDMSLVENCVMSVVIVWFFLSVSPGYVTRFTTVAHTLINRHE